VTCRDCAILTSDTQYDYTKGTLPELLDIVIDSGAKLFVSAVGVPPQWAIEKLHKAGVL
jgi:NAD(P)H-dependent flavin oxidoreductase YrpB (nitropropane dioxygenase family)